MSAIFCNAMNNKIRLEIYLVPANTGKHFKHVDFGCFVHTEKILQAFNRYSSPLTLSVSE